MQCGCKSGNAFACYEGNHGKAGECGCSCHRPRAFTGVTASFTAQLTDEQMRQVERVFGLDDRAPDYYAADADKVAPGYRPDVPGRAFLDGLGPMEAYRDRG